MTGTASAGAALMLAVSTLTTLVGPADAAPRRRPLTVCTPVFVEGAGTVLICAPARAR